MNEISLFPWDEQAFAAGLDLFPADIADNSWVAYHGTSSVCEESIEGCGIRPRSSILSEGEIQSVVDIYDRMQWAGDHGGGYAVLMSFSSQDVTLSNPVFLAESSFRATLYATTDFAGGEACRAMRHAIRDLQRYLAEPDVRERHECFSLP